MGKLLRELDLFNPIKQGLDEGLPAFGTCAGLILLSKQLEDDPTVHFGTLDVVTKRNAYGRQLGSFNATTNFKGIGEAQVGKRLGWLARANPHCGWCAFPGYTILFQVAALRLSFCGVCEIGLRPGSA